MLKLLEVIWNLVKKLLTPPGYLLKDVWCVLQHILYAVIILLIEWFAFCRNDQGQDFIFAITENQGVNPYKVLVLIALTSLGISLWYSARLVLWTKINSDYHSETRVRFLNEWLPRVLGVMPFAILILAINTTESANQNFIIPVAITGLVLFAFFKLRKRIATRISKKIKFDENCFAPPSHSFAEIKKFSPDTFTFIYVSAALYFIILALFLMPVEMGITRWFGPAAIVLLALTYIMLFLAWLSYKNSRRFPITLIVIVCVWLFSFVNNNRTIRYAQTEVCPNTVQDNFSEWLKVKRARQSDSTKRVPVIIVAAEGGGIRALNWTARVLNYLDSIPGFTDHLYAISGVSGGGVGGAMYTAWLRDRVIAVASKSTAQFTAPHFEKIISADYLSPVTAAYLFADNIQNFIPVPICYFDRARWLEDSWKSTYEDEMHYKTFDNGLCALYNNPLVKHNIPNLFINGTMAESGQKVVTSNLRLDGYFPDVLDVLKTVRRDVPLKTAALLCARFTYVTPGGLIDDGDVAAKKIYGHIVDGGYHENTGIETAIEILNSVKAKAAQEHVLINPIVLFIKNSSIPDSSAKVLGALYDLRTPPSAFINAWSRQSFPYFPYTDALCKNSCDTIHFLKIELNRDRVNDIRLPLGWYLSDSANTVIRKYESALTDSVASNDDVSKENRAIIARIKTALR